MKRLRPGLILNIIILSLFIFSPMVGAAEQKKSSDIKINPPPKPNPTVITNPIRPLSPGEKALQDLERIKKINNDLAIRHFSDVLKKNSKDAAAYARRGKAYSGNKEYDKASKDFDKAIELDAKQVDAYTGRAVIRLIKKEYDGCWKDVHKAESLGGKFWPSFEEALKSGSGRDK